MMKIGRSKKQAREMMSSDAASDTLLYNTAMAIKPLRQSYDWKRRLEKPNQLLVGGNRVKVTSRAALMGDQFQSTAKCSLNDG